MASEDKPRIQWSAIEIVGIDFADNPKRPRKTEEGKTVIVPTNDYPVGVISELTPSNREVVPITPFVTRPYNEAADVLKALGGEE